MTETQSLRLLVVANRTESAPELLKAVEERAGAGCEITLLIPPERDPDVPDWTPETALGLVRRAAGDRPVTLVDPARTPRRRSANWSSAASATRSSSRPRASTTSTGTVTAAQARSGPGHSRHRHPAGCDGLVVLARLPARVGPARDRPLT